MHSIEERQTLQKHLAGLEEFIGSVVHKGYVAAKTFECQALSERILDDPTTSVDQLLALVSLKGELKANREQITTFEDARATLNKRVEDMLAVEDEARQQKPK